MSKAQPFIKWVGGKRELLPDLLPYIPPSVDTYFEPFLGGGALFWKLASEGLFRKARVSDLNAELVNLYQIVRDSPNEFMGWVSTVADLYRKAEDPRAFYNGMRPKRLEPDLVRAARFLFLNKTCFNGLHRMNKKGEFNSPWGKEVDVAFYDPENIRACSELLQGVEIKHERYAWLRNAAEHGDLVYFDPPYIPVSKTSDFTSYTTDDFTMDDQKELAGLFRELSDRGVAVMLSNSDAPEIRELYAGFEIKIIKARRNVNSKGDARGPVNEVLVLGRGMMEAPRPFDLIAELEQEFT